MDPRHAGRSRIAARDLRTMWQSGSRRVAVNPGDCGAGARVEPYQSTHPPEGFGGGLMGQTALFRANAGVQIGTGHVMRSLALAQAWKDKGGDALLLTGPGAADAEQCWLNDHFSIERISAQTGGSEDARATVQAVQRFRAGWLVLDG